MPTLQKEGKKRLNFSSLVYAFAHCGHVLHINRDASGHRKVLEQT